jgi:hypothetical protein
MNKRATFLISSILYISAAWSQGCIAIRNLTGSFGHFAQLGYTQSDDKWMVNLSTRYFESSKLLSGKEDITYKAPGINLYESTTNIGITRMINNDWFIALDIPVVANSVGSPDPSGVRHTVHAFGIGDIRLTVYRWLIKAEKASKGNLEIGLGLKFPTGKDDVEDYYYLDPNHPNEPSGIGPIHSSLQLGDGGTGINTEINGYYLFSSKISAYGNFYYLINPTNQNGVSSFFPGTDQATIELWTKAQCNTNSVPDNYTLRVGGNFTFNRLVATAGLRFEGAPANDLIGENDGYRQAGHIYSVEPGLQYKFKRSILYTLVTIPFSSGTIQTVPDKRISEITGTYYISAGHFANALFYAGYTFTF